MCWCSRGGMWNGGYFGGEIDIKSRQCVKAIKAVLLDLVRRK